MLFRFSKIQHFKIRESRRDKSWKISTSYNSIQEFNKVSFNLRFLKLKEISENIYSPNIFSPPMEMKGKMPQTHLKI